MIKSTCISCTVVSLSCIWWQLLSYMVLKFFFELVVYLNVKLLIKQKSLKTNLMSAASSSNAYTKTFTGIDEAGKRLADEVSLKYMQIHVCKVWTLNLQTQFGLWSLSWIFHVVSSWQVRQLVRKTESLKRISFLAHSLGGLFARYAISVLYSPDTYNSSQPVDPANCMKESSQRTNFSKGGMIAGLEPMNFITLATPHLGVRGKKQVCLWQCSTVVFSLYSVFLKLYTDDSQLT